MTKNGLFFLGGPGTHLHDILWAVHDGTNRGRSKGGENFGEFPVTVGGRGRAMRVSLVHVFGVKTGGSRVGGPELCVQGGW